MNTSPVSYGIRIFFLIFFVFLGLSPVRQADSSEHSVPNDGSPYTNLKDVPVGGIVHVPTGISLSSGDLIDAVSGARVIYVGETHDNVAAHRVQLKIIRDLEERFPGQISVGMEMFRRSAQTQLDVWAKGQLPSREFKRLFHEDWGPGYNLYAPIFDFLKERKVPLIGLKSSRETEDHFRKDEMGDYPEMDFNDVYHRAYSMSTFGGHTEKIEKPYRMLTLWEESMARTVSDFLRNDRTGQKKLIVLAGGFGIPKRAFRRIAHAYAIVLPTVVEVPEEIKEGREMEIEHVSIPLYAADYLWKVDYELLPDKRIRLGVMLKEEEGAGLRVRGVGDDSPAQRAGIKEDDLLTEVDGMSLSVVPDLADYLQTKSSGDAVRLNLLRAGKIEEVTAILSTQDKPAE
jgi:uncharacterized iron-regulated protein